MAYDLRDRNLVKREHSASYGGYFSIHRTIQQGLLHKMSTDQNSRLALEIAFQRTFLILWKASPQPHVLQIPDPQLWPAYEKTMPHILSFLTAVKRTKIRTTFEFARLLSDAGMNIWERGLHSDGLRLLVSAEEILDALHADEDLLRANIHIIIGLLLQYEGILTRFETIDRFQKALHIRLAYQKKTPLETYTRDGDVLLHNAWSDYAYAMLQCNKYQEAEEIYRKCHAKYVE